MKTQTLMLLVGYSAAQMNTDEDASAERPDWQDIDPFFNVAYSEWPTCTEGSCDEADQVCAKHMWAYNGQTESG